MVLHVVSLLVITKGVTNITPETMLDAHRAAEKARPPFLHHFFKFCMKFSRFVLFYLFYSSILQGNCLSKVGLLLFLFLLLAFFYHDCRLMFENLCLLHYGRGLILFV